MALGDILRPPSFILVLVLFTVKTNTFSRIPRTSMPGMHEICFIIIILILILMLLALFMPSTLHLVHAIYLTEDDGGRRSRASVCHKQILQHLL